MFIYFVLCVTNLKLSVLNMVSQTDLQEIDDHLPDQNVARDFYAKYDPKEVLGKYVFSFKKSLLISSINVFVLFQGCI